MASSVNDNILQATGGPSVNDGLAIWYGKQPTRSLPDAERGWLTQRPYTINNASINDMWVQFLRADGYTGGLNDMLAAYWAAPSRVLPTFAGSQYGTIDTPITFTGDFEVEFEFSSTDVTTGRVILGGSTGRPFIRLEQTTGTLKYFFEDSVPSTVFIEIPTINWADGKIHAGKISRVGDLFTLECEGNTISTTEVGAVSQTWDKIGTYSTSLLPFVGQILSVKFTDAGTVVANYVFDSGSITDQPSRGGGNNVTLINFAITDWNRYTLQRNITHGAGTIAEAWVGDNLITNGTFDADTDWTKAASWSIASGVGTHVAGVQDNMIQAILTQGVPYLLTVDIVRIDAGALNIYIGAGASKLNNSSLGTVKFFGVAATDNNIYMQGNAAFDGDIDNVITNHILEVA